MTTQPTGILAQLADIKDEQLYADGHNVLILLAVMKHLFQEEHIPDRTEVIDVMLSARFEVTSNRINIRFENDKLVATFLRIGELAHFSEDLIRSYREHVSIVSGAILYSIFEPKSSLEFSLVSGSNLEYYPEGRRVRYQVQRGEVTQLYPRVRLIWPLVTR